MFLGYQKIRVAQSEHCFHSRPATNLPTRKTIIRNNRNAITHFLPIVGVYNHRSIWNKLDNYILKMEGTEQGISLHNKVWGNKEDKKHQHKLEDMFEISGISYVSTPRPGRRGGNSAISCNNKLFSIKKVTIENPLDLEVTFAIVKI